MSWFVEGWDRDSLPLPHSLPLGASQIQIPQEEVGMGSLSSPAPKSSRT